MVSLTVNVESKVIPLHTHPALTQKGPGYRGDLTFETIRKRDIQFAEIPWTPFIDWTEFGILTEVGPPRKLGQAS